MGSFDAGEESIRKYAERSQKVAENARHVAEVLDLYERRQTRVASLIEVCANVALGFVVSALCWPFVAWWQGYEYTLSGNMQVTGFFTVLSISRGYLVRRFVASGLHRVAGNLARSILRRAGHVYR